MNNEKSELRYLYKYRAIDGNTKRIITDNELYFSNPEKFNDPYDCKIPKDTKISEENIKIWIAEDQNKKSITRIISKIYKDPDQLSKIVAKNLENSGICCFSTEYNSILMWSHYADYHKGICFKFDITKDPDFFRNPLFVDYVEFPPRIDYSSDPKEQIEKHIRTKYIDWKYEHEVRILKNGKEILNNKKDHEMKKLRIFKFKSEALKEIFFGEKTKDEDIKIIKDLCEKSGKYHVKFSRMELMEGKHYGLEIDKNFSISNFKITE